jgi:hypothetical protein
VEDAPHGDTAERRQGGCVDTGEHEMPTAHAGPLDDVVNRVVAGGIDGDLVRRVLFPFIADSSCLV